MGDRKPAEECARCDGRKRFDRREYYRARQRNYHDGYRFGKGISKQHVHKVFQPGSPRKTGWGLGLSLSKRIIEQYHKGQLFVKNSEIGKGTTFRVIWKSKFVIWLNPLFLQPLSKNAQVAKLVDALLWGGSAVTGVGVRISSAAQKAISNWDSLFLFLSGSWQSY